MTMTTMTTARNARPARRLIPMLALLVAIGTGACGGDAVGDDQSVVVIHVNIEAGVPELRQIEVVAHLGSAGLDSDLYFPTTPQGPIASGATLALLIPTTRSGLLDLILFGLNGQNPVARGNGQTTIVVGGRVDPTITLRPCSSSGSGPGC
jgi:hypothetical protein